MTLRTAVAAAALLLAACQTAPELKPDVGPPQLADQEFQVVNQSLTDCAVRFTGKLAPYPEAFTVEKAVYEFVVDGAVLKSGERPIGKAIAADAEDSVVLEESFTYVKDAADLQAMEARSGSLLVALRGKLVLAFAVPATGREQATTRRVEVEFARGREVRTPRLPHLRLTEFEGGRFSDSEVQVVYHLGVVNENPFIISISGVDYAITLAGKEVAKGTIGAGERVSAASTGVFDVTAMMNEGSHGKDVRKLIKGLVLPFHVTGTLRANLYAEKLDTKGEVKLTPPR